jgi:outer membrane receptor protein involved in Fe transport
MTRRPTHVHQEVELRETCPAPASRRDRPDAIGFAAFIQSVNQFWRIAMTNSVLRKTSLGAAGALVIWLVAHGAAMAQTSVNGSIRGLITDEQGAVLPGVTVVATSPTVAGSFLAVSDSAGLYRLIDLPPGEYTLAAELSGFSKLERRGVLVRAGLNLALDIVMRLGGITETVEVKGDTPMLEVSSPIQAVNIQGELQRALPTSSRRDYTDFLEMTPGMNSYVSPSRGAGLYHMRGSRIESHVVQIDGADMGSLRQARPDYIGMSTDTLEDVQVKSAVSDASAPLGNGAVMNIATPTGSNSFKASASMVYANRDWHGENNPAGETNSSSNALLDASAGGPVLRDRSWFFGSFRKINRQIGISRPTEQIALSKALLGSDWKPFDNAFLGTFWFVKSTTQLGKNHRLEAFYQYDRSPTEANYLRSGYDASVSVFGGVGYNARLSSVWGKSITTRFSASYNNKALSPKRSDFADYIIPDTPYREVHAGTFLSAGLITGTGYLLNAGIESSYTITPSSKLTFTGDLTYYRGSSWLGSHELQVGFYLQPRLLGSTTVIYPNNGFNAEYVVLKDPANPAAGYIPFRRTYRDPAELLTSDLKASDNAIYVQDAWKPAERLTITGGLRLDWIKARDLMTDTQTQDSLEVGPRFGATYALTADNNNIVYGSWGRVHDLVALGDIPTTGSASASTRNLYDNNLDGIFETERFTPGATTVLRNRVIDPDRHQPFFDEWTLGYRRQFRGQISVSAGFAHRVYKDRPAYVEINGIYEGVVFKGYKDVSQNEIYLDTNDTWNQQVYDGLELAFTKRSERLQVISSYVRQWPHLTGTWQPNDPAAFIQPDAFPSNHAIGTPRRAPSSSLPPGGADVFGNTAWQDHTFRLSFIYTLPFDLQAGTHYVYQSGPYTGPIVTRIAASDPRFGPASVTLSNGRVVTNPLATTIRFAFPTRGEGQVKATARQELNLKLTKSFRFSRYRIEAGTGLYNVTNHGTIERYASDAGQLYSPNYLGYEGFQPPRSVDLTLKFTF